MDSQILLKELSLRSESAKRSRFKKIISNPFRMLFPEIIKSLSIEKKVNAKTFWGGKMEVVLPEEVSLTIWRYGYFDEDVCFYLLNFLKKDMVFIDVGAHFGFFTALGSYLVGEKGIVLSVEATPKTSSILKNNNIGRDNVKVFNIAAYNEDCELEFNDYGVLNSAYNSIFQPRKENKNISKNTIILSARKIDNIIKEEKIQKVDIVKIDAESSEFQVLGGMEKIIVHFRPKIILEIGDFGVQEAYNSEKIISFLIDKHYEAYEFVGGKLVKFKKSEPNKYKNLIFIPDENKL